MENKPTKDMESNTSFTVVTVCTSEHGDVWKHTSKLMVDFFGASKYKVYVPEKEITEFIAITPPQFEILSEEKLGNAYLKKLREKIVHYENQERFGWYLQQFHKIEAIQEVDTEGVLIWDADCVPLKKMRFFDEAGTPLYMVASKEMHQPYFELIEKTLGIKRVQDNSFVIPGFPMRSQWVEEFIFELAGPLGKEWYEKLLDDIDFSLKSGFSEFETLGTWVANRKPAGWKKTYMNWERFGQSRFGYAKSFDTKELIGIGAANNLDIISFENWDKRGMNKIRKYFLRKIRNAFGG